MSLSSWKREFYRTPANKVSKRYALRHSLKKWIGLKLSNTKKHKVSLFDLRLVNNASFEDECVHKPYNSLQINDDTCALCKHFLDTGGGKDSCDGCPLNEVGFCCLDFNSPYDQFTDGGSAIPMIKALRKALKKGK